jgi:putative iron-regulated protein
MKPAPLAILMLAVGLAQSAPLRAEDSAASVLTHYADIAAASYGDSVETARALQAAVDGLIALPSEDTLMAARKAWLTARAPYQQTEVFRFGNAAVDDWEGKVNAWPLDEGLIDYVDASYGGPSDANALAALNVIANPLITVAGTEVDASQITPALIADTLNEADGAETNVARGYHAIEFLLWGQDLNGTGPGAGNRPFTDYVQGQGCTGGNCDRRAAYLQAATALLVADLEFMAGEWSPDGAARATILADEKAGLIAALTGMGSLSYGEQAGERMRLGLMLNDPEEEHDCFSDNTHNSHYYDGLGVQNIYLGRYLRADGTLIEGPSLSGLVAETDPGLDTEMRAKLETTMSALSAIKTAAEGGFAYDMMLEQGNAEGEALVMGGVNSLIDQTRTIERIVTALGLDSIAFEGSDSLDDPAAVFQ